MYLQQLQQWRDSVTQALAAPEESRASPSQTKEDRRRIKELEREVRRKDKALAESPVKPMTLSLMLATVDQALREP